MLHGLTPRICGTDTNRLRLTVPTLFSASPFSLPEAGLQKRKRKPQWALHRELREEERNIHHQRRV